MINEIDLDQNVYGANKTSNEASSADIQLFQNTMGMPNSFGGALGGFSSTSSHRQISHLSAQEGLRLIAEQSRIHILEQVVNKKNQMILESRGNAAKKASEIAKEISF